MTEEQKVEDQPQTETTETQEAPKVASTDILAAYNSVLAEKDRQMRDAIAELERMRAAKNEAPQLTPEESSKKFFENPVELIRNEINRALQPINQSITAFTQKSQYDTLKGQMRQDPRFKDLDKIEKEFDTLMQNQQIEPNAMIGAYYAAYGMVASTEPQRLSGTPATPAKVVDTMPPHLRPSAPAAPVSAPTQVKRAPLTENERRLMVMNGIKSEDEWHALMDAPPQDVTKVIKKEGK